MGKVGRRASDIFGKARLPTSWPWRARGCSADDCRLDDIEDGRCDDLIPLG
jgi:hypothetical protein